MDKNFYQAYINKRKVTLAMITSSLREKYIKWNKAGLKLWYFTTELEQS